MRASKTRQSFVCATALAMGVACTVAPVQADWWEYRGSHAIEGQGSTTVTDGVEEGTGSIQLALQFHPTESSPIEEQGRLHHPHGLNQYDTRQVEFLKLLRRHPQKQTIDPDDEYPLDNPSAGRDSG